MRQQGEAQVLADRLRRVGHRRAKVRAAVLAHGPRNDIDRRVPVSYTHLDVYKRQGSGVGDGAEFSLVHAKRAASAHSTASNPIALWTFFTWTHSLCEKILLSQGKGFRRAVRVRCV